MGIAGPPGQWSDRSTANRAEQNTCPSRLTPAVPRYASWRASALITEMRSSMNAISALFSVRSIAAR
jgi:hypothetical protein